MHWRLTSHFERILSQRRPSDAFNFVIICHKHLRHCLCRAYKGCNASDGFHCGVSTVQPTFSTIPTRVCGRNQQQKRKVLIQYLRNDLPFNSSVDRLATIDDVWNKINKKLTNWLGHAERHATQLEIPCRHSASLVGDISSNSDRTDLLVWLFVGWIRFMHLCVVFTGILQPTRSS